MFKMTSATTGFVYILCVLTLWLMKTSCNSGRSSENCWERREHLNTFTYHICSDIVIIMGSIPDGVTGIFQ